MKQQKFPSDFMWGAASAAAQIEGAYNEGGKGLSIWDVAPKKKIKYGENCHTSCDHYHRYKEDVALMIRLGLKSYRFSVSWSRIMPERGVINNEGLDFYKNLASELCCAGIEPLVTIFHWDTPLWMQKLGGWKSGRVVEYFRQYTEAVVDALSDKVSWWMTMNEPSCFIMNGYLQGVHAPFKRDYLALNALTKNCMLAHAAAVETIRARAKLPPKIGISMASSAYVPNDESEEEITEAYRKSYDEGFGVMSNKWWLDPILLGNPVSAYGIFRTSKKHLSEICQPLDFVGINVYTPMNAGTWGGESNLNYPGAPRNSMGWLIDERVMYYTLKFTYERYGLPILITENGMADNDFPSSDGGVHDPARIQFIESYLKSLHRAMSEGIPVLGYQYWSVMDNFEWAEGYDPRFGLIYIDYKSGERIIKDSGFRYAEIIRTNGEILFDTSLGEEK